MISEFEKYVLQIKNNVLHSSLHFQCLCNDFCCIVDYEALSSGNLTWQKPKPRWVGWSLIHKNSCTVCVYASRIIHFLSVKYLTCFFANNKYFLPLDFWLKLSALQVTNLQLMLDIVSIVIWISQKGRHNACLSMWKTMKIPHQYNTAKIVLFLCWANHVLKFILFILVV